MLGICEIDQIGYEIGIIMEFANLGSLKRQYKILSELQTAQVCLDICKGLQYLHSKDIIHHNLKLENVLLHGDLNSNMIAKIADFGLPRAMEFLGSIQYMAPELAQAHPEYNHKIDIYSLTIIIFELYTKQRFPFKCNSIFPMDKINAVEESITPEIPNDLPAKLLNLIPNGWNIDPKVRPDLDDFISVFEDLIELQSNQSDLQEEITSLTIRKHIDNLGEVLFPNCPVFAKSWNPALEEINTKKLRLQMVKDIQEKYTRANNILEHVYTSLKNVPKHIYMDEKRTPGSSRHEKIKRVHDWNLSMALKGSAGHLSSANYPLR